VKTPAYHAYGR